MNGVEPYAYENSKVLINKFDVTNRELWLEAETLYSTKRITYMKIQNLQKEKYLKGLSQEQFQQKAAQYMGDIYSVHAFREGNSRSLTEFMRELAQNAGYNLDFLKVSYEKLRDACFVSVRCDYEKLHDVMKASVSPLDESRKMKRNAINQIMACKQYDEKINVLEEYLG